MTRTRIELATPGVKTLVATANGHLAQLLRCPVFVALGVGTTLRNEPVANRRLLPSLPVRSVRQGSLLAPPPGFEPRQADPKSTVLPLHYGGLY